MSQATFSSTASLFDCYRHKPFSLSNLPNSKLTPPQNNILNLSASDTNPPIIFFSPQFY